MPPAATPAASARACGPSGGRRSERGAREARTGSRGGHPSPRRALGLVDARQQLAGLDGLARLDPYVSHRARPRRGDLVLHLHGFNDEEALAALDPGARLDQHGDHLAGHGRPHLVRAVDCRGTLVAQPGALVEEAEAMGPAPDGHLELVAPAGDAHLGGGVVDQEREGARAGLAAVDDPLPPVDRDPVAPLAERLDLEREGGLAHERREARRSGATHGGPRAARAPASASAAPMSGRSASVASPRAPGLKWRAMKPVSMSPARKAGCWRAQRWKAMLAVGPTITYSPRARSMRSIASSRWLPHATSLERIGRASCRERV